MKSLNLIIETALKSELNQFHNLQNNNNRKNNIVAATKQINFLKMLHELHCKHIGPLTDTETMSLNEQLQKLQLKQLNEQIAPKDHLGLGKYQYNPTLAKSIAPALPGTKVGEYSANSTIQNKAQFDDTILKSEKVREMFANSPYHFLKAGDQSEIRKLINKKQIKRWTNTAADNFFLNIIKQDPNYGKSTGTLYAGYVYDASNTGLEDYDYEIVATDSKGKSWAFVRFSPNGLVQLMPDLMSVAETLTYKVVGNKVNIYATQDSSQPLLTGTPNDYTILFEFNKYFQDQYYDPYKGAGRWRSIFLDILGYKRAGEAKWKTQKEYEDSWSDEIDNIQTALDWMGLIPGYGDVIDLFNGVWYYSRGKRFEAILSWIAVIPVAGTAIKLGFKGAVDAFRFGGKTGLEAIEAALKGGGQGFKEALTKWFLNNKQARTAAINFLKQGTGWFKSFGKRMRDIAKNLRGRYLVGWVGRSLDYLNARYIEPLEELITNWGKSVDDVVQGLEVSQDLVTVGAKAEAKVEGYVAKKGIREVLRGLAAELPKAASWFQGIMYRLMGRKWWDAFHRSMIDYFITYIKRGTNQEGFRKFIAVLATTRGGADIILKSMDTFMQKNMRTLLEFFLQNVANIRRLLPEYSGRIARDMSDRELTMLYYAIRKRISTAIGTEEFPRILNQLVLQPLLTNANRLAAFVDDVIISCVQQGNAMFQLFARSFWNRMRAMLPGRIAKFYEGRGIGYIKYDFKGGRLFDLQGVIGKWISEALSKIPSLLLNIIMVPVNLLLTILDGLLNLKRIDIFYNEFKGMLEELGIDADGINEKQSVIASIIIRIFGTAPFEFISDVIDIGKGVVQPEKTGLVASPSEYDFVEKQRFQTDLPQSKSKK